jgi:hypothetical protein
MSSFGSSGLHSQRQCMYSNYYFIINHHHFIFNIYTWLYKTIIKLIHLKIAFNRGQGGVRLSGEFKRTISTSYDRHSVQPSFYQSNHHVGSIGWGLRSNISTERSHTKSIHVPKVVNMTTVSSLMNSNILKLSKNPIICKDRHHISKIDKDYNTTGSCGFLKLPGSFASHLDKTLKMQPKSFYCMNMSYQKKCVQELTRAMGIQQEQK